MKKSYEIVWNHQPSEPEELFYFYSSIKNIRFSMSENCCSIQFLYGGKKTPKELASPACNLFADAIKKAMLIHLIRYSKSLEIQKVQVLEEGKTVYTASSDESKVYSLVKEVLPEHPIAEKWKETELIQQLLLLKKNTSSEDQRVSSLFALLCAKSKEFESDRFHYLWIAINGMYNYFWNQILRPKDRITEGKIEEAEKNQIKAFALLYELRTGVIEDRDEQKVIFRDVRSVINQAEQYLGVTRESLSSTHRELAEHIQSQFYHRKKKNGKEWYNFRKEPNLTKRRYDLDVRAYLLFDLPYYCRCNVFHANQPVKLFSFEEESEIKLLKVINSVMEDFLDQNLNLWFDPAYIKDTLEPKATKIWKDIGLKLQKSKNKQKK